MARKIVCKDGRSFTYLTPQEKCEKYQTELEVGFKLDYDYKPKVKAGYNIQKLSSGQKKYRQDYISTFEKILNMKKTNSKGILDFFRDYENNIKYYSHKK